MSLCVDFVRFQILVCTDVAARGLDIPAVDWIIQVRVKCVESLFAHVSSFSTILQMIQQSIFTV